MKKVILGLVLLVCATCAVAQDGKVVRRIKIRHADPYLIMRLLMGEFPTQPETSVIDNTPGGTGGGQGGFGGSGFGGSGGRGGFGGSNGGN